MLRVERVLVLKGRSKSWLAEALGVSPSHVTRVLNGERPWIEAQKERAAAALGWPVEELARLFEKLPKVECPDCEGLGVMTGLDERGVAMLWLCDGCDGYGFIVEEEGEGG